MKRTLALVVVIAAALAVYFLATDDVAVDRSRSRAEHTAATNTNEADLANRANDGAADAERRAALDEDATTLATSATDAEPATRGRERVHGRVVLHDGAPSVGARVELSGSPDDRAFVDRRGDPVWFEDLVATTDATGAFEFEFDAPRAHDFDLLVQAPFAPTAFLGDLVLAPRATLDVGTIELGVGGAIEAHIVREDGTPVRGSWYVSTRDHWISPHRWSPAMSVSARSRPHEHVVRLEGVAVGTWELVLRAEIGGWKTKLPVRVEAGVVSRVDAIYDGPPIDRRIEVAFILRGLDRLVAPEPQHVRLTRADGTLVDATARVENTRLVWDDVEPGEYLLAVDDPRFEPLVDVEVRTADDTYVELIGSASVTCRVTSAADGAPIAGAYVEVVERSGSVYEGDMVPTLAVAAHDAPGVVEVTTDGAPQVWLVGAPGFAPQRVEFASGFEPLSNAEIDVALEPAVAIRGRVLDANGATIAFCMVHARAAIPDPPPDDTAAFEDWYALAEELDVLTTWTDADGRFVFAPLDADAYDLWTAHDLHVCGFAAAVSAGSDGAQLVLAPFGRVEGRIVPWFPKREHCDVRVARTPIERVPLRVSMFADRRDWLDVQPDGTFALDEVAAGRHTLEVRLPGVVMRPLDGSSFDKPSLDPLTFHVTAGATTELVVDASAHLQGVARVRITDTRRTGLALHVDGLRYDDEQLRWLLSASGSVGNDGLAHVTPLSAGRWRLVLRPVECTWSLPLTDEFDVAADQDLDLAFDIELVRGRVVLTSPSGAPLPACKVVFAFEGSGGHVTSDADGVLDLTLPPGTHRAGLRSKWDHEQRVSRLEQPFDIVWTRDGPRDPVVVVPDAE